MSQILTDEEITLIIRECARGSAINRDGSTSHRIARAIEQAILNKLSDQEPSKQYTLAALEDMGDFARMAVAVEPIGAYKVLKDYIEGAHPLPQPDLAAEIERLSRINSELCRVHNQHVIWGARFEEQMAALRQQLSAAQSRIELLEHDAKTGDYETLYAQTVVELSAAQASEDELLEALETLACLGNGDMYGNSQGNAIAQKAITAHKVRKEQEE